MATTTITEALQEIKTINERLAKKRETVKGFIARDNRLRDPLEREQGGSAGFITRERQAMGDLEKRIVRLRTAIQNSNLNTPLTLGDQTKTVAEWLTWRKEVATGQISFVSGLILALATKRAEVQGTEVARQARRGYQAAPEAPMAPIELTVNVNERELAEENENLAARLSELDGKLSLLNATTKIEVE